MSDTLTILADAEVAVVAELAVLYEAVRVKEGELNGIRKAKQQVERGRQRQGTDHG